MPTITVSVSDERHPAFEDAVAFMDNNNFVDWEDMEELYPPEEIEVDWDDLRDEMGL